MARVPTPGRVSRPGSLALAQAVVVGRVALLLLGAVLAGRLHAPVRVLVALRRALVLGGRLRIARDRDGRPPARERGHEQEGQWAHASTEHHVFIPPLPPDAPRPGSDTMMRPASLRCNGAMPAFQAAKCSGRSVGSVAPPARTEAAKASVR